MNALSKFEAPERRALRAIVAELKAGRVPSQLLVQEAEEALATYDRGRAQIEAAKQPLPDDVIRAGLESGGLHLRLTGPQWDQLRAMERDGPQPTFGAARAAVQNRLERELLTVFVEKGSRCVITKAGRAVLADNTKNGVYAPWKP